MQTIISAQIGYSVSDNNRDDTGLAQQFYSFDLSTGQAEVIVKRAKLVDTLNELHRGKNAGAAWKAIIDISAIVIIALSVIGYVLFFSLRFRLRTSLILTGLSLAGLVAVVMLFTP